MACYLISDFVAACYDHHCRENKAIAKLVKKMTEDIAYNFEQLAIELFAQLIDASVERVEAVKAEDEWIAAIHGKLNRNADWKLLCDLCQRQNASIAAQALHFALKELQGITPLPEKPLTEDIAALRKMVMTLKSKISGVDVSGWVDAGKDAAASMKEYGDRIGLIPQATISTICRDAVKEFERLLEVAEDEDILSESLGFDPGNSDQKLAYSKAIRKSKKLQEIIKLAGKLIRRAEAAQGRKEEIRSDVGAGDRIDRAVSSELAKMRSNFAAFAARLSERAIGVWKGEEDKQEGSVIVILDSTGSMAGFREVWAKAVTWAIGYIARKQGRKFRIAHYGAGILRSDDFTADETRLTDWLDSMDYFASDSVNDEPEAFDQVLDRIEREDEFKDADIVFVTDGGWSAGRKRRELWEKEFQARVEKMGIKIFTILIQCHPGNTPDFLMERSVYLGDLTADAEIDQIFEAL